MPGLGILVGPGVLGHLEALHQLAAITGCGVVNTWGAKGCFRWDSPYHFGTAGLQALDFELADLGDVDVLVTSGLDPREVTSAPWEGRAEVIDVAPDALGSYAASLTPTSLPAGTLVRPPLYTELAAVVQPMYASAAPRPPAPKWAAALAAGLPDDGLVVAEPGIVGFWVARTFPTSLPGSVVVPPVANREAAWLAASAAAAADVLVTLIAHAPVELENVAVDVWTDDVVDLDPAPLVAVAGDIVAWGGVPR